VNSAIDRWMDWMLEKGLPVLASGLLLMMFLSVVGLVVALCLQPKAPACKGQAREWVASCMKTQQAIHCRGNAYELYGCWP
jgi:hypothetical protein